MNIVLLIINCYQLRNMDNDTASGFLDDDSNDFEMDAVKHNKRFYCNSSYCHRSFSRKYDLQRHMTYCCQSTTQSVTSSKYQCEECHSLFASKGILKQHREHVHKLESESLHKNFTCSECLLSFHNRTAIIQHYSADHSELEVHEEQLTFQSWDSFCQWKKDIEKDTVSSFVKGYGSKALKPRKTHSFTCHRSGKAVVRGSGKRSMKIAGSNKTGNFCPARIHATECNGIVNVSYCPTHIGHTNEAGRLNLSKHEKDVIAGQLLQGVPIRKVLSDISESFSPTKRHSLTSRKDLHNIAASYSINSKEILHQQDALSVDMWVNKMAEENSVL